MLTSPSTLVCLCPAQMFEKQIVIDGKGHLLGRLASVVAKELLNGQCIVVVRSEQIFVTGSRKCCLDANRSLARGSPPLHTAAQSS